MTPIFVLASLIMTLCLWTLRGRFGQQWLVRPFTVFALMATLYHVASEVLVRVTGAESPNSGRPVLFWVDQGALIAATTLAAMTAGYLTVTPRERSALRIEPEALAGVIDWRIVGVLTLPLLAATIQGRGYITGSPLEGEGIGITGLSMQFFVPLVVLTSFGYLLRYPARWMHVMVLQSALLAMAGQRLEVFVGAASLAALAARVGIAPKARHVIAVLLVAGTLTIGVTVARESGARDTFYSDSGATARVSVILEGVASMNAISSASNLLGDAGLRLNSNAWTGGIAQKLSGGADTFGVQPIWTSALGMVPSALYPSKLADIELKDRSVEVRTIGEFGMPDVDYLPGHLTFYLGAVGWVGMLGVMGLVGALMGLVDAWVMRSTGYVAALLHCLLVQSALFFERGLDFYLWAMRTFVVAALVLWLLAGIRSIASAAIRGRPARTQKGRLAQTNASFPVRRAF